MIGTTSSRSRGKSISAIYCIIFYVLTPNRDTFFLDPTKSKKKQTKADGGLKIPSTGQALLIIEGKRCSHDDTKEDFEKLVNTMTGVNKRHKSYVAGILVVGEAIVVYLLINQDGYRCIYEISRCYFPVAMDDFARLPSVFSTLKQTMHLMQLLVDKVCSK